jgi:hypothetical protein
MSPSAIFPTFTVAFVAAFRWANCRSIFVMMRIGAKIEERSFASLRMTSTANASTSTSPSTHPNVDDNISGLFPGAIKDCAGVALQG